MLKPLSLFLCLLSFPAFAADWKFEGGATPIAYADNGQAQFQFACRGGDLAMAYWVREPGATVAAAPSLSLAMNAGGGNVSAGGDTGFAQDFPMIHHDGSSVIIRGPVARQWARTAQQARETMELAFVKSRASSGLDFLDRQRFGATGSAAAIAKVLANCG
jgi:outer membrane scaffolding protein for murein synthesis (MipA/OmpV family)